MSNRTNNQITSPDSGLPTHPDRQLRARTIAVWGAAVLVPLALAAAVTVLHNDERGANAVLSADSVAWPTTTRSSAPEPATSTNSTSVAPVGDLITGLEQRLAANPRDAKGWVLLAQSYAFMGNSDGVETAIGRAVDLGMNESELRQRVSLAANASGSRSNGATTAQTSIVVHGVVDVSDAGLTPRLEQPGSKLFITARKLDGSPMPVAVLAAAVTSYPFEYTLSDANAMMPGTKLSDFGELAVSARLSQTGTAQRSNGDLESDVAVVNVAANVPVNLVLQAP